MGLGMSINCQYCAYYLEAGWGGEREGDVIYASHFFVTKNQIMHTVERARSGHSPFLIVLSVTKLRRAVILKRQPRRWFYTLNGSLIQRLFSVPI